MHKTLYPVLLWVTGSLTRFNAQDTPVEFQEEIEIPDDDADDNGEEGEDNDELEESDEEAQENPVSVIPFHINLPRRGRG